MKDAPHKADKATNWKKYLAFTAHYFHAWTPAKTMRNATLCTVIRGWEIRSAFSA
jgi:hypothetical protein